MRGGIDPTPPFSQSSALLLDPPPLVDPDSLGFRYTRPQASILVLRKVFTVRRCAAGEPRDPNRIALLEGSFLSASEWHAKTAKWHRGSWSRAAGMSG
ncbi:hypothetical protein JCM24511_06606 [Saitozyma sp. JCM 24511]|nr:hypothetical protein JCM24511_06606 [Saitozyma sp. JCM 24511]